MSLVEADLALSIEPDGSDPLLKAFLPSKILDYIAARRPVLAITPEDSPSWHLCARGYGWAVRPGDPQGLAELLAELVKKKIGGAPLFDAPPPPEDYSPRAAAVALAERMTHLVQQSITKGALKGLNR